MDAVEKDDVHEYSPVGKSSHKSKSVSISIPVSSSELNSRKNDGVLRGWACKKLLSLKHFIFGVMNPHEKYVEQLNRFVLISCIIAIFIDPLFFYLLSVKKDFKCVVINWPMAITLVVFRSITDLIYFFRILMEFRLAYISPESRVVGAGDLVNHPKKIALHYVFGFFFLDLFIVLPVPQMIVLIIQPNGHTSPGASYAKFLLQTAIFIQYIPRLYRFLPLLAGRSPNGFMFEAAWANFVINLLSFVLAGHVIGSCWYMLGLLRVHRCLRDTCHNSTITDCKKFIDCGRENDYGGFEVNPYWNEWKQDQNSSACFSEDGNFNYGIYVTAASLTTEKSVLTRYIYSSFWGLQQISTLAGNQTPSFFIGEVLFTMGIIGLGLLLFALLIGNMQNFLQGLGRRQLEKSLRRRDVEEWMSHRRLPKDIRRKVRYSEHYHWTATRGVDEETLMENLPEDLQRDIRRHLFMFVKKARNFPLLDEPIFDAICERLRQKTYIKGGTILYEGGFVTKMIFIVRGKMESIEKMGIKFYCWRVMYAVKNFSNGTLKGFVLRAADLEEVITLYDGLLKNRRVQFAIRSSYGQGVAATTIQVAWRYRKKRQGRQV